jgi:hypothetical protein
MTVTKQPEELATTGEDRVRRGPSSTVFAVAWFITTVLFVLFRVPAFLLAAPALVMAIALLCWRRWREALLYLGIAIVVLAVLYAMGSIGAGSFSDTRMIY